MNNNHFYKNIIAAAFLLLSNLSFATPITAEYIIIENQEIIFSVDNSSDEKLFISSRFSSENKTIHLETTENIGFIQIMGETGEIEYQIPVSSKFIHMDISDFSKGTYRLNLLVKGSNKYISTEIKKLF